MNKDVRIKDENYTFKLRTSAVIIENNKILLVRMDEADFLCLPGGYVELGETTEEGMLRELKEEIGKEFEIEDYCGIIENFFTSKYGKQMHEIAAYYKVKSKEKLKQEDFSILENDKGHMTKLEFKWKDINELEKENLKPEVLKEILKENIKFNHKTIKEV